MPGSYERTPKIRDKQSKANAAAWQVPETRSRYLAAFVGKVGTYPRTPEMNHNMSVALKGRIISEETRKKIKATKRANPYIYTEEDRAKLSAAHKAQCQEPEFLAKLRAFHQDPEYRAKASASHIGKHPSQEARDKMSIARTGEGNAFYGKHHTEESKDKMRVASTGVIPSEETRAKIGIACAGERNGSWKGGISNEPYPIGFNSKLKEQIRARDNYTCQLCGVLQAECLQPLCCHHIDYNKENILETNLISLCHRCNGKANTERAYFQMFFSAKIKELYGCICG